MEKIKVGDVFFTSMGNICSSEIKYIDDLYKEYDGLYDPSTDSGYDFNDLSNIEVYNKTLINSSHNMFENDKTIYSVEDILIILKYVGDGNFEELSTKETFRLVTPDLDVELQDIPSNNFVDVKLYHNAMEFAKNLDIIKKNPLNIFVSGVSKETKPIIWDSDGVLYSMDGNEQFINYCKEQYLKQSDDYRREIIKKMNECARNSFDKELQKLIIKDQEIAELENKIFDFKSK